MRCRELGQSKSLKRVSPLPHVPLNILRQSIILPEIGCLRESTNHTKTLTFVDTIRHLSITISFNLVISVVGAKHVYGDRRQPTIDQYP